jgi:hypothetical protein
MRYNDEPPLDRICYVPRGPEEEALASITILAKGKLYISCSMAPRRPGYGVTFTLQLITNPCTINISPDHHKLAPSVRPSLPQRS